MLIAQISDTHILARDSAHPSRERRENCLRQCIADINQQEPDAVIFTGDTVQHGRPDEYAVLRELLSPLEPPLYVVPGNRDDSANLRTAFGDNRYVAGAGAFIQYVVEAPSVNLVALDSTLPGERKGVFCERRQEWLDNALSQRPGKPACLFMHHPPFDVDDHYVGGYRHAEDAAALETVVSRHPQVRALFCGHVHWPVDREWAGIEARIMPSVAVDLRHGVDETAAQGRPVYLRHRFANDTGLQSNIRRITD